ncbi:MAG: hypothetical protein GQF41_4300 [Candidatus Rifleibacterium amylolyticum]|nr:MAG: hypothetical protein GQF41_4300 [Candidatus Rifleibacterium amylolyticum]
MVSADNRLLFLDFCELSRFRGVIHRKTPEISPLLQPDFCMH